MQMADEMIDFRYLKTLNILNIHIIVCFLLYRAVMASHQDQFVYPTQEYIQPPLLLSFPWTSSPLISSSNSRSHKYLNDGLARTAVRLDLGGQTGAAFALSVRSC